MTENVKKIFEILGVEPNVEFKIEDKNCFWKIDEKLNLYYRQGHYANGDYAYKRFHNVLILDLINNPELIVKLPKENKKKLRDLSPEEWDKWRDKNCRFTRCENCIFNSASCLESESKYSWIHHKDLYSDKFLDQEIEVEE